MSQPRPPSPCINICTLDDQQRCLGCRRTLDEIAEWSGMSAETQWRIVAELPQRAGGDDVWYSGG
ncbi:MAG: DUF1289 domain-containing protein [Gammaproteobacteria bacterium]|nr:MAG: DUF1289 domain-containing protein [Gammaproteobacteria bacterium]